MSTPEVPDFSAVPPSPQPGDPSPDAGQQAARRRRRGLAAAGFATALVIGAVSTTAFVADRSQGGDDIRLASTSSTATSIATSIATAPSGQPGDPDADGDRRGGFGVRRDRHSGPGGVPMMGPRGALHGELVVPQRDGTGTQTVVVQSGTVTAVSATSLSVRSDDGYTATYAITSTTRVAARSGGITSLAEGDSVHVLATKSGSTLTAVMVGERPDGVGPRGSGPGTSDDA